MNSSRRFGIYMSDLRRSQNDSHGIINYALGLVGSIAHNLDVNETLIVYANDELMDELTPLKLPPECRLISNPAPTTILGRLARDHFHSLRWCRRDRLCVLHFPKGFLPISGKGGARLIATLHDDIPARYSSGEFTSNDAAKSRYFAWIIERSLERADKILTDSDFSLRRLQETSKTRLSGDSITVIAPGLTIPMLEPVPIAEKSPHLLHLGSSLVHKRSILAAEWTLRYLEERTLDLKLVITGRLADEPASISSSPRIQRIEKVLSNAEMATLFANSRALIFNSVAEGFGLPPVESFCLGTGAVWPGLPPMVDVLRGAPGSFQSDDYEDFARALDDVLALDDTELRRLQEMFRSRYSWDTASKAVLEIYRALCPSAQ